MGSDDVCGANTYALASVFTRTELLAPIYFILTRFLRHSRPRNRHDDKAEKACLHDSLTLDSLNSSMDEIALGGRQYRQR